MVIFHSYVSLPEGNQLHPDVKVSVISENKIQTAWDAAHLSGAFG